MIHRNLFLLNYKYEGFTLLDKNYDYDEKELYIGAYYTNPFAIYNYRDIINSLEKLDYEKSEYIKNLRNTLKNNTAESILDDENIDLYMLKSLYEIFSMPQIKKNNPRAQVLFYEI